MTKMKKFMSAILAISMIMGLAIPAFAQETDTSEAFDVVQKVMVTPDGGHVTINIPKEYVGDLTETQLQDFAADSKNGDIINIESIETAQTIPEKAMPNSDKGAVFRYPTIKTVTREKYLKEDRLVKTLAKGETEKQKVKMTVSLSSSISGSHYADLGFQMSFSAVYDAEYIWTGPGENSEYNSRQFRVKFFAKNYKWTQEKRLMPQDQLMETKSGTATEIVEAIKYSRDTKE